MDNRFLGFISGSIGSFLGFSIQNNSTLCSWIDFSVRCFVSLVFGFVATLLSSWLNKKFRISNRK